jgi:hypothetical protein
MDPYLKKGRNVTTDNFFMSVKLSEKLKAKDTSVVDTVKPMRTEAPDSMEIIT